MCMRLPGESTQWTCKTITVYASQSYRLAPWLASVYSLEIFHTHTQRIPLAMSLSAAPERASPPCQSGAKAPSRLAYAHTCSLRADIFFLGRLPLCLSHTPPLS
jgi:hypothetical protein